MNTITRPFTILVPLAMMAFSSQAQYFSDWEARPHLSVEYRFNKNLSAAGTYYAYIDKNITTYDKSVIAGEINYKLSSWLKAGLEYRYGLTKKENYNELRYSLTLSQKLTPKWKIKYRPMYQQEFYSLDKEELEANPMEHFIRNRITIGYDLTKKMELYALTENYQEIQHGDWSFNRQKSAAGIKLELDKQHEISAAFYLINKKRGKNIGRLDFGYTYTFGYRKNK